MGFSKKSQIDGVLESEGNKKWVIAGISLRTTLKPVNTKPRKESEDDGDEEPCSTTPTAKEARIPEILTCPPAPRKRRTSSRCSNFNGVREFFTPPDLETVFIPHVEKAN
ncbi:cyclin-dependent protein kinase inhibitor SMR6 [Ziziphus jujuba]|uniref:Cyclin-dependent protein kinase inhibitor SMR6 n=2 Tax=Ziziphus jujuba TaxID=326968 RepID=A0A6P3ZUW8_ZIZJJ|nr:cyclin-dependent protein kinase inhibitor SMR6 [Ziziphus jujuba]KAH7532462.1 hypothetical protein FEM48_Zijuj04G0022500 [Ziziphus jujuba var. spinosa]